MLPSRDLPELLVLLETFLRKVLYKVAYIFGGFGSPNLFNFFFVAFLPIDLLVAPRFNVPL